MKCTAVTLVGLQHSLCLREYSDEHALTRWASSSSSFVWNLKKKGLKFHTKREARTREYSMVLQTRAGLADWFAATAPDHISFLLCNYQGSDLWIHPWELLPNLCNLRGFPDKARKASNKARRFQKWNHWYMDSQFTNHLTIHKSQTSYSQFGESPCLCYIPPFVADGV